MATTIFASNGRTMERYILVHAVDPSHVFLVHLDSSSLGYLNSSLYCNEYLCAECFGSTP